MLFLRDFHSNLRNLGGRGARGEPAIQGTLRAAGRLLLLGSNFRGGEERAGRHFGGRLSGGALRPGRSSHDLDLPGRFAKTYSRRGLGRRSNRAFYVRGLRVSDRGHFPHHAFEGRFHHRTERGAGTHFSGRVLAKEDWRVGWAGAATSFAGLYFLTVPVEGFARLNRGDVLVLGCAVLYALQIIYIARHSGKYSLGALSCLQVMLAGCLATIAVPILNVTRVEPFFVRYTFQMEFGVIVTAIFTTALAYPLLVWGQTHTSATNTALILTSEPVFAAITSFFVLHERLGGRALAGSMLILSGIVLAEWTGAVPSAGS